jgi:hypothetical protein
MSHKSKPAPKQSAALNKRKPVAAHSDRASVGHSIGSRKTATDRQNGRCNDRSRPVTAPGG